MKLDEDKLYIICASKKVNYVFLTAKPEWLTLIFVLFCFQFVVPDLMPLPMALSFVKTILAGFPFLRR